MAYRNVMIASDATLRVRNDQLCITTDAKYTLPLEDINCLLIESHKTTLSAYAIAAFAEHGIAVFFCDGKHMPSAVLLPVNQHSRQSKVLVMQTAMSVPRKKRLWQEIVSRKIRNQAKCLTLLGKEGAQKVESLATQVRSGDTDNAEGRAAALYFRLLFGNNFSRGKDCLVNAALNYGYAILRGCIARTLVTYGLEPCLGIFHANTLNNFNLADDLIEPLRPLCDLYTVARISGEGELNTEMKKGLLSLLNCEVLSGSERHSVMYAVERMVKSYVSILGKKEGALLLPEIIGLAPHGYE